MGFYLRGETRPLGSAPSSTVSLCQAALQVPLRRKPELTTLPGGTVPSTLQQAAQPPNLKPGLGGPPCHPNVPCKAAAGTGAPEEEQGRGSLPPSVIGSTGKLCLGDSCVPRMLLQPLPGLGVRVGPAQHSLAWVSGPKLRLPGTGLPRAAWVQVVVQGPAGQSQGLRRPKSRVAH